MTSDFVIQILREALMMAFWLSAPLLAVAFVVGILISLIQIVTSIQDTAFSTIPRLGAFLGAFLISLPWMLERITTYMTSILGNLSRYAR
jgi:flagellar biosynthesis protein FliQ